MVKSFCYPVKMDKKNILEELLIQINQKFNNLKNDLGNIR